jgi:hypothetical protein
VHRRHRSPLLAALAAVLMIGVAPAPATATDGGGAPAADEAVTAAGTGPVTYRYRVSTRGSVQGDVAEFAALVDRTLADPRGWSLGGAIRWQRVASGAQLDVVLASPAAVDAASPVCSPTYSCRVGNTALINDVRWREGSPAFRAGLLDYRRMVVTHEIGHWLGRGHETGCNPPGSKAPVMMQQSIDLRGCLPNPWPLRYERSAVASARGLRPWTSRGLTVGPGGGVWTTDADGRVTGVRGATSLSELELAVLLEPVVGIAAHPTRNGYWQIASDGGIFTSGSAGFHGSMGGRPLHQPIVGMAAHPSGNGYWQVARDGGIFSFDDARFHGSMGGRPLNRPIVGMAPTPSGRGYWLVAADGGIFSFGDARFHGSTGGIRLNQPIVGMAVTPSGRGYWLAAADGGIFAFGDARFHGSGGATDLGSPVVGMAATGAGYLLLTATGGLQAYGS